MFTLTLNKILNQRTTRNLTLGLLLVSQVSFGQTQAENTLSAYSVAGLKTDMVISDTSPLNLLAEVKNDPSQREQKFIGMQREQLVKLRQAQITQKRLAQSLDANKALPTNYHHTFSIYSGYAQLIQDIDGDGYFQTFSVNFDADVLSPIYREQAVVYADLYLSHNGGPWTLYFSTDNFVITGEDTEDEFEVVTQLDLGYITGNYDVLIDLYEVGYSDIVATYSSNDSNELYALPLESSDYDPEYIEVIEYSEHSGSFSWLLGALLVLTLTRRLLRAKK